MQKIAGKFIGSIWILIILSSLGFSAANHPSYAERGIVVSTSKQASEAGIEILKKGGNAIDAAVATGFALAVTSSSNGNIGGGGFLVARLADGTTLTLDFREKAPAKATQDMYLDILGNPIKGASLYSHLSSGVPGSVDGLLKIWRDYGSGHISRGTLLAPAIRLAEKGFPLSHFEAKRLNRNADLFKKNSAAAAIFIRRDNKPWKAGDLLKQRDLANTLKRIAKNGRAGFYEGKTANLIVAEMKSGHGLITYQDLANYASKYRSPVTGSFHDYKIISMGPPSSGGVLLINMLNMLEQFQLDSIAWNSSDYVHLLTEVERRAYADRAEYLGDPDFWLNPLEMLTSKDYARERVTDISMSVATPSVRIHPGNTKAYESRETTHYSVVDQAGNAVSVTTTLNLGYGNGVIVNGAGFFLNNEMDDFSIKPGVPNIFGLVGNKANAIQAGKRPLSSMTPTIVLKNNQPFMIIGSPGGSTIITTTLQCILNVTIFGMNIQEAVSAPRFHSQWLPDVIMIEPRGLSDDTIRNLEQRGHKIIPYKWGYIGQANGIIIKNNGIEGGADSRGENTALGY